ncbi:MAG: c-type cytochrome, partial [Gemmatimonadales bacterium]
RYKLLAVLGLLSLGCSRDSWQRSPGPDEIIGLFAWFANMKETVAIKPYEMPLQPVEGTVPITGVEPALPITTQNLRAIDRLTNPVSRTSESIERGRDRYEIYCLPCHGDAGLGDGPIDPAMFGIVPPVVGDRAQAYTDGYLYTIVRHGRGAMTAYGDRIRGDDRWHVVNYIRVLQGAAR